MSDIKSACCFTGHRPSQLPWGYNEFGIRCKFFKFRLKRVIMKCIKQNYKHFISGMALGVDIIAAEIVLDLKSHHPDITLECALPCKNQSEKWNDESILRYINVAYIARTLSSMLETSRLRLGITCGSKLPLRSRGAFISTFPWLVLMVFSIYPLRLFSVVFAP